MTKNYYDLLGVARDATDEQIKRAFRELALQYHPDRNDAAQAHQVFVELNEAYKVLSDQAARAAYNLQYDRQFGEKSHPSAPSGAYQSYAQARARRASRYGRTLYSQRFRYKGGAVRSEDSVETRQERPEPTGFAGASDYYQARREAEQAGAAIGFRVYSAVVRGVCLLILMLEIFLIADRLSAYPALPEPIVAAAPKSWTLAHPSAVEVVTPSSRLLVHSSFMHMLPKGALVEVKKTPWLGSPVKVDFRFEDELRSLTPQGGLYGGAFMMSWVVCALCLATVLGKGNPEANAYLGSITLVLAVMVFFWMFYGAEG